MASSLTFDAVASLVNRWALNPKFAVPLALILRWQPLATSLLSSVAESHVARLDYWTALVAAASVVYSVNGFLNKQCANNWTSSDTWDWDQEIVVVTGGSSGLGASIAQQLIARNRFTRIAIVDVHPLSWTPPADARLRLFRCDLSDTAALKAACQRVRQEMGHPSVLFNNAGMLKDSTVLDSEPADVQRTVMTNLVAPILMTAEFLPDMVRRNHGHIVSTGSASALTLIPGLVNYAATKAGLAALHEGLQLELTERHAAPKIRLTLGCFGFIQTPMVCSPPESGQRWTPLLKPEVVAERLVQTVYSGYGETIHLPTLWTSLASLRGGPEWLFWMTRRAVAKKARHGKYKGYQPPLESKGRDDDLHETKLSQ